MDLINTLDIYVLNFFSVNRTPWLNDFFGFISSLFDFSWAFLILVVLAGVLVFVDRGFLQAVLFVACLLVSAGFVYSLKILFDVDRPTDSLIHVLGKSFPSHHASVSLVFSFLLVYFHKNYLSHGQKFVFYTISTLVVILVSISRLYLGAHWLSDVIGGIIIGYVLFYLSTLVLRKFNN